MLYKDYDRRCSIEKKKSGRQSQGARRQDELIGGKPTVVKWLWLCKPVRKSKKSSGVQSSAWSQEDRSEDSSARKGSTEYRTQKIESLVYVL
jgi:hypothetical protein